MTMRIMVLDDDRTLGRAIGRILKSHEVVIEHDPGRALERMESGDWFDLVLCDFHMPKWSGLEIVEVMKAWYGTADAPTFVLMTGDVNVTASTSEIIIHKPFTVDQMRGLVAIVHDRQLARSMATTTTFRIREPAVAV